MVHDGRKQPHRLPRRLKARSQHFHETWPGVLRQGDGVAERQPRQGRGVIIHAPHPVVQIGQGRTDDGRKIQAGGHAVGARLDGGVADFGGGGEIRLRPGAQPVAGRRAEGVEDQGLLSHRLLILELIEAETAGLSDEIRRLRLKTGPQATQDAGRIDQPADPPAAAAQAGDGGQGDVADRALFRLDLDHLAHGAEHPARRGIGERVGKADDRCVRNAFHEGADGLKLRGRKH